MATDDRRLHKNIEASGQKLMKEPGAIAYICGGPLAPSIRGVVYFYDVPGGTEVSVIVSGLPRFQPGAGGQPPIGPHGFHIHHLGSCEVGEPENPFQAAGEHWNPDQQPHGNHAGDFPVLFSNHGTAQMRFFQIGFELPMSLGRQSSSIKILTTIEPSRQEMRERGWPAD